MRHVDTADEALDKKPNRSNPKWMTGKEFLAILEETGAIGMWADRDDIGDSSEFARKLRKSAETRPHDENSSDCSQLIFGQN